MKAAVRNISIFFVLMLVVVGAVSAVKIQTLKDDPGKYDGREVRIRAVVDRALRIPLTDFTIYVLDDNGSRLALLSKSTYENGDRVRAKVQVVAYSDSYDDKKETANATRLASDFTEYLSIEENRAQGLANGVIKVIATVSGVIEGVYLLIEV